MSKELKRIPVNLWDDYYDDGYVPDGEIQQTHMYIEEYDNITDEQKYEAMRIVIAHVITLDLTGVEISDGGTELYFKHLTHERREKLIPELEAAKLEWNGISFDFYSES
jgi:hypothetical protein